MTSRRIYFRIFIVLIALVLVILLFVNMVGNTLVKPAVKASIQASDHFERYRDALLKDNLLSNTEILHNKMTSSLKDYNRLLPKSSEKSQYQYQRSDNNHNLRKTNDDHYNVADWKRNKNGDFKEGIGRELGNTEKKRSKLDSHYNANNNKLVNSFQRPGGKDNKFANWLQILMEDGTVRDCITGNSVYSYDAQSRPFIPLNSSGLKDRFNEDPVSRKTSFVNLYNSRAWGQGWDPQHVGLNASGRGATLDWTQEVIAALHLVINAVKQKSSKTMVSILDIPCGDLAWMSRFLKTRTDVQYTGMDIVPDLIAHHKKAYKAQSGWSFINGDVLSDDVSIGQYDIILCRMMLQHLHDYDVAKLLDKFSESGSSYILFTTFSCHDYNQQLVMDDDNPGRFRPINLQISPFSLRPPLCVLRDGSPDVIKAWEHYMALWPLPLTTVKDCDMRKFTASVIPCQLYACF